MRHRLTATAILVVLAGALVTSLYQPWLTQWGSTPAEQQGAVVGDALVADGTPWTRSITVDASPAAVWPWLAQMGVDKGGFSTYDWAEQLFGDPVHNTTRMEGALR